MTKQKVNCKSYIVGDSAGYGLVDCVHCGTSFNGKPPKGRPQRYCSRKCLLEATASIKESRIVEKSCLHCGDPFKASYAKRNTRKFCSIHCRYRHNDKHASVKLSCQVCGKEVRRWKSNVFEIVTCSNKCMGVAKRKDWPTSGNFSAVRKWLSRFGRMTECANCGYNEIPDILVVHHRDRNRKNNTKENLAIICPNCHALEHLLENKTGWKHENPESTNKRQRMDKNRNYKRG